MPLRVFFSVVLAATLSLARADPLPVAQPEDVGLDSVRISQLVRELRNRADRGEIPGAVLMIVKDGKVAVLQTAGWQDKAGRIVMRPDSIFRIASMTKPIVTVAALMLAEEGKIALDEPIGRFLPAFAAMTVGVEERPPGGYARLVIRPAEREITVRDLMRHTAGFAYGQYDSLVDSQFDRAGVLRASTLEDMVARIGRLPLKHEPGTAWEYSVATDVLARLVEVVSGYPIDDYIRWRITGPLGMVDTGYWVENGQAARLAQPQSPYVARRILQRPTLVSGGSGLVSTATDYARFCQFLLNGGELDGTRLLKPESVALMTTNQLPDGVAIPAYVRSFWGDITPDPGTGIGFGLGVAVRLREQTAGPFPGPAGEYWWMGAGGSSFVVDPHSRMITILLTQQPNQMRNYLAMTMQISSAMTVK